MYIALMRTRSEEQEIRERATRGLGNKGCAIVHCALCSYGLLCYGTAKCYVWYGTAVM